MAYRVGIDIGFDTSGARNNVQALADQAKSILSNIGGAVGLDTSGLVKATDAVKKVGKDLNLDLKLEPIDFNKLGLGKLQEALEKTGQLGKPLGKIRFGDKKEYAEANRQLLDMRRNLEAINRTGFGHEVNRRAAILGPDAKNPFGWDWEKMYQGNVQEAERQRERFWGKAIYGKDNEPPKTPETLPRQAANAPAYGRSEGQAEPRGPGLLRRAAGWAWNTGANVLGTAAGLGGLGSIVGGLLSAFREHQSVMQSAESIYRKALPGQTFESIEQHFRELGRQLQLSAADAGRLSASFVEASGRIEASGELALGAGRFGRGYGLDPAASAQQFGRAALVGYGSDKGAQREFAGLLAATIADSSMLARPMQVMEDLVGHVSEIADREGRTAAAGEVGGFAQFMADLYRDNPALRGGGAQNIVQGLNQFGAGGDMQKEAMAWAAFSTTGRRDFIEFEKFKDQNVFDVVDGRTKLERLMDIAKKEAALFPGSAKWQDKMAYVLKTQTGMSMPLAESAMAALSNLGQNGGSIAGMQNWLLGVAGKGLGEANQEEAFANLARLYQGGSADYRAIAKEYVSGYDQLNDNEKFQAKISQAQRDQLEKLLESGNDAELKTLLPGLVANSGAANNPAEAARMATAGLANTLETNIGPGIQDLVRWMSTSGEEGIRQATDLARTVIPGLKTAIEGLTGAIAPILEKLGIITSAQAEGLKKLPDNEFSTYSDQFADQADKTEPHGWFGKAGQRLSHAWSGYAQAMDKVLERHGKPTRMDMASDWATIKKSMFGPRGSVNRGARAWTRFWRGGTPGIGDAEANMAPQDYPGEGLQRRPLADTPFGRLIARGEGDYNSVNLGAKHGYRSDRADLESMTVDAVMAAQQRRDFNAAGRYQITRDTLADAYQTMGLTGAEKFNKVFQDRLFEDYLVHARRPALSDYLSGRGDDVVAANKDAAREWASVADPDTGSSFYRGIANNRASISAREMQRALRQTRVYDYPAIPPTVPDIEPMDYALPKPWLRPSFGADGPVKIPGADNKQSSAPPPPQIIVKAPPAPPLPKVDAKVNATGPNGPSLSELPILKVSETPAPRTPKVDVKVNATGPATPAFSTLPIPKVPEVPTPKTPEKLDKVSQALTQQQPPNARLDGQVEMALILQNERGQELHRRTGIMVSEPMLHGSGGSNNFTNRFIWQDTSVVS